MPQLIAQLQFGELAVQGRQLALQAVLLQLHGRQGHIGGLSGRHNLVLQASQLTDGVRVVLLHVAVLDGVKLLAYGGVGVAQLVIGAVILVIAHKV